jgi:hypothetical protein
VDLSSDEQYGGGDQLCLFSCDFKVICGEHGETDVVGVEEYLKRLRMSLSCEDLSGAEWSGGISELAQPWYSSLQLVSEATFWQCLGAILNYFLISFLCATRHLLIACVGIWEGMIQIVPIDC